MSTKYRMIKEITGESGYEVIIAGGGPAGVCAALAAARSGAHVLLLEATGCLGGMGTSGLVSAFDPMANGEQPLVGGIMLEIVETMYSRNELAPQVTPESWRMNYHSWTPYRAEGLKQLLDDMVVQAGVYDADLSKSGIARGLQQDAETAGVGTERLAGTRFVAPYRHFGAVTEISRHHLPAGTGACELPDLAEIGCAHTQLPAIFSVRLIFFIFCS